MVSLNQRVPGSSPGAPTIQSQAQTPFVLLALIAPECGLFPIRGNPCSRSQLAKRQHLRLRVCSMKFRSRHQAETGSMTGWWGSRLNPELFRIETKGLELPAPFGWQIAETLDADAAGQAAFDGGFAEIRR
jgi:hypothetical protein